MLEATKERDLSDLKTRKDDFDKKKGFKVKTRKGSLNHIKKKRKMKKENERSSRKPERAA